METNMNDPLNTPLAVWVQLRLGNSLSKARGEGSRDRGAGLVEYSLLVGLIAILCVAALRFLSGNVSSGLSSNTSSMFGP
jgi:Flp pilus assembly pilin Flp